MLCEPHTTAIYNEGPGMITLSRTQASKCAAAETELHTPQCYTISVRGAEPFLGHRSQHQLLLRRSSTGRRTPRPHCPLAATSTSTLRALRRHEETGQLLAPLTVGHSISNSDTMAWMTMLKIRNITMSKTKRKTIRVHFPFKKYIFICGYFGTMPCN